MAEHRGNRIPGWQNMWVKEHRGDETPGDGAPGDGAPGDGAPGDGAPGDETPGDRAQIQTIATTMTVA